MEPIAKAPAQLAASAGMAENDELLVILGPTASGKSELAMALAKQRGAEMLSVDSMQVYRGMDIGTAKPTAAEQAEVKHHLIDLVDPTEMFTVARFVELADAVIAQATKPLILCGGTPLYSKALFEGLFEGPPADDSIRTKLRVLSGDELHSRLTAVDPQAAARIHTNDAKRLIRALEVFELTGQPISSFQTEWETPKLRHRAKWIGLSWDREVLNRRINARVTAMMYAGWVYETRRLVEKHGRLSKTAGEATGYAQLIAHLEGRMSPEDATEQIKIATRQLARRQMKWFRRWEQLKWVDGALDLNERLRQASV
jgi:tRNA dimethylallyltransferase